MRWVGTFPVTLAATSSGALRGALKICDKTLAATRLALVVLLPMAGPTMLLVPV
jgi:hypothetical protein